MAFWSPHISYVIGLITTDGNLSKDKRHISLTSTEKQLLRTFRECLNIKNKICDNPPRPGSPGFKVTFGNVQFYNKLLKIGLMPNKTFKLGSLNIPNKYFADFLRGHIDGDGSIINYLDKHNSYKGKVYIYHRLYITLRSASLKHIKWIRRRIYKNLNIRGCLSGWKSAKRKNVKIHWTLRFCKNDSLVLLKYIYYDKDAPCLQRKRNVAISFLRRYHGGSEL